MGLSQEKATVTLKNASIHSTQLAQLLSIVTVLEAETTHRRCSAPLALPSSLTCSERWGSGRTWTRRGKPFLWAEVPWPHGMWTGCRAGPGGNVERVLKGGAGRTKDLREDTALGRGVRPHSPLHETGQGPGGPGCPRDGRSGEQRADFTLKTREGFRRF